MERAAAECPTCNQKITAEEIEIGMSLRCPECPDVRNNCGQERKDRTTTEGKVEVIRS